MHGVFITGTGTDVGKTTFSVALTMLLQKKGINVGVMKPFATGKKVYSAKYKSKDTALLAKAAGTSDLDNELNPFYYPIPASPFMAVEMMGKKHPVDISKAMQILDILAKKHDFLVVEGIGGIMVPLTEREYVADFVRLANLPVIIVSEIKLGTLNHTFLTVNACREFGIKILGIIISKVPKNPSPVEKKTPEIIEKLTGIPILGAIPFSKELKYNTLASLMEKNIRLHHALALDDIGKPR